MKYDDINNFNNFVMGLSDALKNNTWEEYMTNTAFPIIYYDYPDNSHNKNSVTLTKPYYDEISIDSIKGFLMGAKIIIPPEDKVRVLEVMKYIINDDCMPLSVIKYENDYYLVSGRHRLYAHIVLSKTTIPVSVQEISNNDISENSSLSTPDDDEFNYYITTDNDGMIMISKPFSSQCDGIAYPEKALEFFDNYHLLFKNVEEVNMRVSGKRHILSLLTESGDIISFNGCCSAGNHYRSSRVTCEILRKCGYSVNMDYISTHSTFTLCCTRDAHSIDFTYPFDFATVQDVLIPAITKSRKYRSIKNPLLKFMKVYRVSDCNGPVETDMLMLYSYIKSFYDNEFLYNPQTSFLLYCNRTYYFIVGTKRRNDSGVLFIFYDTTFPFNNLTLGYLGSINDLHGLYGKISCV